jgi:NADPH2:quinone reductase
MRAVQVTRLDGPEALELAELPDLEQRPEQVLIDVRAAGVTFPDVLLTQGLYQLRPELPFVPGSEVAGVVNSAPSGSGFKRGERVAAFPGIGGFAEQIMALPDKVFRLPDSVSFAAGAAFPMNYLTVQFALVTRGRLKAGETVLVQGAAGGIGTAAIQMAKALGARVIAVVSTPEKAIVAESAGADEVVYVDGFRDSVKELTSGRGVDLVLDPVGGERFTDSLRTLAPYGRLLVLGFTAGEIPVVRVNRLLLNNVDVVGVGWGMLAFFEPGFMQRQWDELLPLIESGALDPVVGNQYPLDQATEAVLELEQRRAVGKVLLIP